MRNVSSECNDAYPRRCALQVWPPMSLCLDIKKSSEERGSDAFYTSCDVRLIHGVACTA